MPLGIRHGTRDVFYLEQTLKVAQRRARLLSGSEIVQFLELPARMSARPSLAAPTPSADAENAPLTINLYNPDRPKPRGFFRWPLQSSSDANLLLLHFLVISHPG